MYIVAFRDDTPKSGLIVCGPFSDKEAARKHMFNMLESDTDDVYCGLDFTFVLEPSHKEVHDEDLFRYRYVEKNPDYSIPDSYYDPMGKYLVVYWNNMGGVAMIGHDMNFVGPFSSEENALTWFKFTDKYDCNKYDHEIVFMKDVLSK